MHNRTVTHYAEPIGYIFGRKHLQRAGRSYPARRARLTEARKPAGRSNRPGVSRVAAGNLQAPAPASPRTFGSGTAGRSKSAVSAQPGTVEGRGFVAGTVPFVLECESDQLESSCRSRARQGNRRSRQRQIIAIVQSMSKNKRRRRRK